MVLLRVLQRPRGQRKGVGGRGRGRALSPVALQDRGRGSVRRGRRRLGRETRASMPPCSVAPLQAGCCASARRSPTSCAGTIASSAWPRRCAPPPA